MLIRQKDRRSRRARHVLRALVVVLGLFAGEMLAQTPANPGFERLKALVGEWEGDAQGRAGRASYKLVSNGTVLMETLQDPDGVEMVTMYHPDGADLMARHYCAGNNQPRMRAKVSAGEINQLVFTFVDVTNLTDPRAGHMRRLVLTFPDRDHLVQEWTWREGDRDETLTIRYVRKK